MKLCFKATKNTPREKNMKNSCIKLPTIILAVGLILAIASCFFTGIVKEPTIKEHEFDYSVTYRIGSETKTYDGTFRCSFVGHDRDDDPTLRLYDGVHTKDGNELGALWLTVAQKEDVELMMAVGLDAAYLMGDPDKYEYVQGNDDPYFEAIDAEGYSVDVSEKFDAEIISWEYPEPIENSFRFAGFSRLYSISMLVMLAIAFLTVVACLIFVKKDPDVSYKTFDIISIIANFAITFIVIPFLTIVIFLFPLTMDAESLLYQIFLSIPALTAFTIAASIALRRKGFAKTGFFVQFVCPVLFFTTIFVESLIHNLFL